MFREEGRSEAGALEGLEGKGRLCWPVRSVFANLVNPLVYPWGRDRSRPSEWRRLAVWRP